MNQAYFSFDGELSDFLPPGWRETYYFERTTVKDAIEALGVPHTEVDVIVVNGVSVDFAYQLRDGDRVTVYPVSAKLSIEPLRRLRPPPPCESRFVLDVHLGKLATYLRLVGFDSLYHNKLDDDELARISSEEERILLTRDRGLLKRSIVIYGYYVRHIEPEQQVSEVLRRFDLLGALRPFHRCTACNGLVEPVAKEVVLDHLLPKTRLYYDEFYRCQTCGRVYWRGSHYERMLQLVERVRGGLN